MPGFFASSILMIFLSFVGPFRRQLRLLPPLYFDKMKF
jgi:hypothetical protein